MENRQVGIIATIATAVFCGFPGLIVLCLGAAFAATSRIPGAKIDVWGSNDPRAALLMGLVSICLGVLCIAIPIGVGFFTLRKRPSSPGLPEEPVPPPF